MTASALKKEIKNAIEAIDDKRILEAVYILLNNNVQRNSYFISDADMRLVEEREAEYKSGKTKTYTVEEVKKKILKNHGKK